MKVREIMTKEIAYCTPGTSIKECAELMLKYDCGEIPILRNKEDKRIIGVITDRDITCRVVANGLNPTEERVEYFMTTDVVTVKNDDDIKRCKDLMVENQIRRLPVVDENKNCIGIVSQAHIARQCDPYEAGDLAKKMSQPHRDLSFH